MTLDIGAAIRDGIDRTFARNGLVLMAVFVGVQLASSVVADTINLVNLRMLDDYEAQFPPELVDFLPSPESLPLALDVGLGSALALALVVAVVAEAVRIVAVRVLVSDRTDAVPGEFVRRNIGYATLNGFVGGIVVAVLVGLGLIFLVVPGIFLALAFFFVRQVIAVEDVNFIDAMEESWRLTKGSRIELFALAVIVVVVAFVASLLGGIVSPTPIAARVVDSAIGAVTTVFGIAVAARAYVQLREGESETEEDLTHWDELDA